jgi:ribosome maturation factor RimP
LEEQILGLLAEKFIETDFKDCFVVDIKLSSGNKLEVFIDCDSGLTLEKCQQISRFLEEAIDEDNLLGETYSLDVSSPGLDRPLKLTRQYLKNIGRQLNVTLNDGTIRIGTLKSVGENGISLEETQTTKEGKKKKTTVVLSDLPFAEIKKAMVVIRF